MEMFGGLKITYYLCSRFKKQHNNNIKNVQYYGEYHEFQCISASYV